MGVGPDELLLGRPERLCVVGPTLLGHQPVEELLQLGHNPVDEGDQPYLQLGIRGWGEAAQLWRLSLPARFRAGWLPRGQGPRHQRGVGTIGGAR